MLAISSICIISTKGHCVAFSVAEKGEKHTEFVERFEPLARCISRFFFWRSQMQPKQATRFLAVCSCDSCVLLSSQCGPQFVVHNFNPRLCKFIRPAPVAMATLCANPSVLPFRKGSNLFRNQTEFSEKNNNCFKSSDWSLSPKSHCNSCRQGCLAVRRATYANNRNTLSLHDDWRLG